MQTHTSVHDETVVVCTKMEVNQWLTSEMICKHLLMIVIAVFRQTLSPQAVDSLFLRVRLRRDVFIGIERLLERLCRA